MAEKPEDLNLPTSVVTKIIKESLPSHVKVSKEANVAIAKAASVFVLYATSCSNNAAMKANRKTIHGNDVISAMGDMEFDKFVRPLENSLENWKKSQQKKKDTAAAKKKADSERKK
ncbi:POLE3 [Lepeophtheirus salmonis]|uniref:DNA polymerase epsilon subunit 3 n=1 Tax=Lepeophtheirus salmonis TaxID=72036 RepID=A0A7R8HDE1_LEPSM|nr:POLE3 [Lepeophtheirus salmonis]CAF3033523.1 POLE3 [Lepeophtheirus salmonis]